MYGLPDPAATRSSRWRPKARGMLAVFGARPARLERMVVSDNERRILILVLDVSTALALSGIFVQLLKLVTEPL